MSRLIRAVGPLDARIVVIGEAGGRTENEIGLPFAGVTGHKLTTFMTAAGLRREDCRLDNVYPFQPPANDLATVPGDVLDEWAVDLHQRIADLTDPWVIVPLGNIALRALLRRPLDDAQISITKYRGSILPYQDANGRTMKLVPSVHPAAIYHQRVKRGRGQEKSNPGKTEKHCRADWMRIACESTFRDGPPAPPTCIRIEEPHECDWFVDWVSRHLDPHVVMTIDIECPTGHIDCVGFAIDPERTYVVVGRHPRAAQTNIDQRLQVIRSVCATPNPKVLQNGTFDCYWLWFKEQITVRNYRYDCTTMAHTLDPIEDFDLAALKSLHLRGSYHKDEAKSPDKVKKYASQFDALLSYNAMDCSDQIELFYILAQKLRDVGRWDLYEQTIAPLHEPLVRLTLGGIRVDRAQRCVRHALATARTIELQDTIAIQAGQPLHAKRDLSNKKLAAYLYGTLGLPPQHAPTQRTATPSVNEVALRKLRLRYPERAGTMLDHILEHRRAMKLLSFLDDAAVDADGFFRSTYMPLTETGRMASSKNPFDTGGNGQNIDREVRDTFIPDHDNHVLIELDLSQAESRLVYALSGDPRLREIAERSPEIFDQHRYNASKIFGIPEAAVTAEQRYFGKRVVHGAQRGLGGEKMSETLLTEGVVRTKQECQRMIDAYLCEHPGMQDYFTWVQERVIYDNRLINAWGFVWDVTHERKDAELYRRAFSFLPQSNVAFLMNQCGFLFAHQYICEHNLDARIVLHGHDSIVVSVCADARVITPFVAAVIDSLQAPIRYDTRVGALCFSIPVEMKVGTRWGDSMVRADRDSIAAAVAAL